jgi:flagellar motor component MotA
MSDTWTDLDAISAQIARSISCANAARREGLLALENSLVNKTWASDLEYSRDDLFDYGLRLVIDGTDSELIDRLMSRIIATEYKYDNELTHTLKQIQKESCLSIQRGDNPRILMLMLTAYLSADHAKKVYKIVEGEI